MLLPLGSRFKALLGVVEGRAGYLSRGNAPTTWSISLHPGRAIDRLGALQRRHAPLVVSMAADCSRTIQSTRDAMP